MSLIDTEELFDRVWWRGTILTRPAFAVISLMTRDRQHDLLDKFVYIDVELETVFLTEGAQLKDTLGEPPG